MFEANFTVIKNDNFIYKFLEDIFLSLSSRLIPPNFADRIRSCIAPVEKISFILGVHWEVQKMQKVKNHANRIFVAKFRN